MNKNQFFYSRKITIPSTTKDGESETKLVKDSFNVNKVIRTITMDNGDLLLLLDDLHQRKQEVPIRNKKGAITGMKNEVNAFQSELTLLKEDVERFYQLTNIEL